MEEDGKSTVRIREEATYARKLALSNDFANLVGLRDSGNDRHSQQSSGVRSRSNSVPNVNFLRKFS